MQGRRNENANEKKRAMELYAITPTQVYTENMFGEVDEEGRRLCVLCGLALVDMGDEKPEWLCAWCEGEDVGEETRQMIQKQLREGYIFDTYDNRMEKRRGVEDEKRRNT